MKFSLFTLILFTFVAALSVNLILLVYKSNNSAARTAENLAKIETSDLTIRVMEARGTLNATTELNQHKDRLESGKSKLLTAFNNFSEDSGKLTIDNNLYSIREIPTYQQRGQFKKSFRIYVPMRLRVAISATFHELDTPQHANSTYQSANDYFHVLPTGESVVTFAYQKGNAVENDDCVNSVEIHVNSNEKQSWKVVAPKDSFGISASVHPYKQQANFEHFTVSKLVTNFKPASCNRVLDLKIVNIDNSAVKQK